MDLRGFEKRRPDPTKLIILVKLRERAGLTQDQAGEWVGLEGTKRRDSVRAWETGASRPAPKRRPRLIGYLLDGLRLRQDPELFFQVWDDIMVGEWNWHPLSEEELRRNLPGSAPPIIAPLAWIPDGQAAEQSPSLAAPAPQPARPVSLPKLPPERTPFVERKTELEAIRSALERPKVRWLTLTGVGGAGKTRLALRVVAGLVDEYGGRVCWVELEDVGDATMVMATIAKALEVPGPEGTALPEVRLYAMQDRERLLEALRYALQDGRWLLVLDSFERVIGAAPEVSRLLAVVTGLKVLVTSRTPLDISWEHLYIVPLMDVPSSEALPPTEQLGQMECVSLFVQTVQRVKLDFELDQENAAAVAEICVRLSGLPLAIELVALSIRYYFYSPPVLLDQLRTHYPDRMPIPIKGLSDSHRRHQSLSDAFEWSLDLLSPGACTLFGCLSVFVGGFTPSAVDAVCADLLSGGDPPATGSDLKSLMEHGLVGPFSDKLRRHTMPAIVREYAAERLEDSGKRAAVRKWHAERFLGMLKEQAEELKKSGQPKALVEMERELGNLRAAWEWAVEQACWKEVAQAAEPLARFYDARWRTDEAYTLFRQTAATLSDLVDEETANGSEAIHALVELLAWQGRFEPDDSLRDRLAGRCRELLKELACAGYDVRRQKALVLRVFAHSPWGPKTDRARTSLQKSLSLYRDLQDCWGEAVVLLNLGGLAWDEGRLTDAGAQYEASLTLFRAQEDQRGVTTCLHALHEVYGWQERLEEAHQAVNERMTLADEWGDMVSLVLAHEMEGSLAYITGAFDEAAKVFERGCIWRVRELGDRAQQAYLGAWLGHAKLDSGDYAAGYAEAEHSRRLGHKLNYRRALSVALPVLARNALREERYEEACRLYQETLDIAHELGYDRLRIFYEGEWAAAELHRGRRDQARRHLCVALRATAGEQSGAMPIRVLPAAALWLASQDKVEWATELYALAKRYPHVANSRWIQDVFGRPLSETAENSLSRQDAWEARARGRARDLQATVRELLDELARSDGS